MRSLAGGLGFDEQIDEPTWREFDITGAAGRFCGNYPSRQLPPIAPARYDLNGNSILGPCYGRS